MREKQIHPLRRARLSLARLLTQVQLADFAGVSVSTIERAESGKAIRVDCIQRLCAYLEKDAHKLGLIHVEERGVSQKQHDGATEPIQREADAVSQTPLLETVLPKQKDMPVIVLIQNGDVSTIQVPTMQELLAIASIAQEQEGYLNLVTTSIQEQEIKQACSYMHQSLDLILQAHAMKHLQRVRRLREQLEPWSTVQAVKDVDERLRSFKGATI